MRSESYKEDLEAWCNAWDILYDEMLQYEVDSLQESLWNLHNDLVTKLECRCTFLSPDDDNCPGCRLPEVLDKHFYFWDAIKKEKE